MSIHRTGSQVISSDKWPFSGHVDLIDFDIVKIIL